MIKYDIYSQDNRSGSNGYVKIGTYPLQPKELENYNFPLNNNNIIIDAYWFGNAGSGQHAKFGVALKNSSELNIRQIGIIKKGDVIDKPLAYVRTTNSFDIYLRANNDITNYLNVKCNIIESKENRFIPLTGNKIEDISSLSPTYLEIKTIDIDNTSKIRNCILSNKYNTYKYHGNENSDTIEIPDFSNTGRYVVKIYNLKETEAYSCDIFIVNNTLICKNKYGDSQLTATLNNGVITISGLAWGSYLYYEIDTLKVVS